MFSAVALLVGLGHLAVLALATTFIGGIVALVSVLSRPTRALVMLKMRGKGDFGPGVPYGVAIALAAAALVWATVLKLPVPELLPHR